MKVIDFIEELQRYDPSKEICFEVFGSARHFDLIKDREDLHPTLLFQPIADGTCGDEWILIALIPLIQEKV